MKKEKNTLLLISVIVGGLLLVVNYIGTSETCTALHQIDLYDCIDNIFNIAMVFYIFMPVFFFSLITYFMKDQVFQAWKKFTYIFVPVTIFLVLIASVGGGPDFGPDILSNGAIAFLMSLLFAVISIILIIKKLTTTRQK